MLEIHINGNFICLRLVFCTSELDRRMVGLLTFADVNRLIEKYPASVSYGVTN